MNIVNVPIKTRLPNYKNEYVKLYLINGIVISEHRYIMANYLKRELEFNEIVHHIDGNIKNNDISNLEIITRADHTKYHTKSKGIQFVKLRCPNCNIIFEREYRQSHLCKTSQKYTCCSKTCIGKITNIKKTNINLYNEKIKNNVIETYRRFDK